MASIHSRKNFNRSIFEPAPLTAMTALTVLHNESFHAPLGHNKKGARMYAKFAEPKEGRFFRANSLGNTFVWYAPNLNGGAIAFGHPASVSGLKPEEADLFRIHRVVRFMDEHGEDGLWLLRAIWQGEDGYRFQKCLGRVVDMAEVAWVRFKREGGKGTKAVGLRVEPRFDITALVKIYDFIEQGLIERAAVRQGMTVLYPDNDAGEVNTSLDVRNYKLEYR